MTNTTHELTEQDSNAVNLGRIAPAAAVLGVIGVLILIGMIFTADGATKTHLLGSYLFGFIFWIGITLGFFGIALLHYTVRGRWSVALIRILEAGGSWVSFVVMFALFIPILLNLKSLYEWADPAKVAQFPILQHKHPYLNEPFFFVRFAAYLLLWGGLAWFLRRSSLKQEETKNFRLEAGRSSWGAPGMVMFFVSCTFAVTDWVMSLDKGWYSTMYAAWSIVSMALGGLALSTLIYLWNAKKFPFNTVWRPDLGRDQGNMLFTLTMLWGYTSLSQFLIIWNGNLTDQTPYYIERSSNAVVHTGSVDPMTANFTWGYLGFIGIVGQFFIPFFALITPRTKKTPMNLAKICIWMFVIHITDVYLYVIPSLPGRGGVGPLSPQMFWDFAAFLAIGFVWVAVFASQIRRAPLLPSYDTRLQEAAQNAH